MAAIEKLKSKALEYSRKRYPSLPEHARVVHRYSDRSANALTRCICDYLKFDGHQVERVANMGRPQDNRKRVTDIIGRTRIIGSVKWIPGQGTKGTADIHAVIRGRAVKIEVKHGRDRQSEAQKQYQKTVESAGGLYIITRTFEEFLKQYKTLMT